MINGYKKRKQAAMFENGAAIRKPVFPGSLFFLNNVFKVNS